MSWAFCTRCDWRSANWPTDDQAGCESTWHVFEQHRDIWVAIFGSRPPLDPDPRRVDA